MSLKAKFSTTARSGALALALATGVVAIPAMTVSTPAAAAHSDISVRAFVLLGGHNKYRGDAYEQGYRRGFNQGLDARVRGPGDAYDQAYIRGYDDGYDVYDGKRARERARGYAQGYADGMREDGRFRAANAFEDGYRDGHRKGVKHRRADRDYYYSYSRDYYHDYGYWTYHSHYYDSPRYKRHHRVYERHHPRPGVNLGVGVKLGL